MISSPQKKTLRAVAFDMDGLMFNTEDVYWDAADTLLKRRGLAYDDELSRAVMGLRPEIVFRKMIEWHKLSDDWESLHYESEEIFLSLLTRGFAKMPELDALLKFLENHNIPKCICTSSTRRAVDAILDAQKMSGRFDFILAAADITQGKPSPEIYAKAAANFGVAPHEMLVLEDSKAGMESGFAAGACVVMLRAAHNAPHVFDRATFAIDTLNDPRIFSLFVLPKTLEQVKVGESAIITAITLEQELESRLAGLGIFRGAEIKRIAKQPLRFALGETRIALDESITQQIEVVIEVVSPSQ